MINSAHIEVALSNIRSIFEKASERIEALQGDDKIAATELAKDLAAEVGMTGPNLYPTIKFLLDKYPGFDITRGAHGGIRRSKVVVAVETETK